MSMESNENRDLPEEQTTPPAEENKDGLSEAERQEILSVFAETNENKRRRSGFRLTVKNQLILIGSVLVLAGVLLGVYFLFLQESEPLPAFYEQTASTQEVLDGLEHRADITFCNRAKGELSEETDPDVYRIYAYATLYADRSSRVKLSFAPKDTFNGVRIECNGQTMEIPYGNFYRTRAIDGKVWGFDGEALFTNALLTMTGKEVLELKVRPLNGYDEDGCDVLVSGGVVMFPMVARENIDMLTVTNGEGQYVVVRNGKNFYFSNYEQLSYNADRFASLLVDCRYVITAGKLDDQLDYAVYGLDSEKNLTCKYLLMTTPDKEGNRFFHYVWVGKPDSAGTYYYARYFGGKMDSHDKVVESYYNPRIFLIPRTNVEGNLIQPVETFFDANLVTGISQVDEIYSFDQVHLDHYYYDEEMPDFSATILNMPVIGFSDNITSNDSNVAELLRDKKPYLSSGLTYRDWTKGSDAEYLVGLNSSDGEPFSVIASVTNIAADGVYECSFGLLLDSENETFAALLPENISIRYSTDGISYRKLSSHGLDFSSHPEGTVQNYSFRIESEEPVVKIELTFTLPKVKGYLVMDDIRITANGEDAVPNDALSGVWRMVKGGDFVPEGKNYAYMDSTNFSDFLYSIATLQGDSVAKVGISHRGENKGDDVIDMEMLAEFGLDRPATHVSYLYKGLVTDLYISARDEENQCYYAYSTITGDVYENGKTVTICTGLVARISASTAAWLEWDPLELVDHSLVGMFVYEIQQMTVTYEGTDYVFNVKADGNTLTSVTWGNQELDERSFRYLYLSIVQLNMRDTYTPADGDTPTEYLRVKIKTTSDEKEYVFYRVSSSRAYYTINGSGGYYCLFNSLRNVTTKLQQFINGEQVGK